MYSGDITRVAELTSKESSTHWLQFPEVGIQGSFVNNNLAVEQ